MRWVAVLIVLVAACGWVARRPAALVPLPPEATFTVGLEPAVLSVEGTGQLVSSVEQPVVLTGVNGQLEEIVEEGAQVAKGQVVARISTFQWEEQERTARQEVAKKQAEMKRTQRENASAAADDAKKTSDKSDELTYNRRVLAFLEGGPDPRTLESLALKIQKAKLEDAALARRLEVQQTLKERGFLSELDYESVKTDQEKSRLERAKQENLLADKRDGPRKEERARSGMQVTRFELDHELARASASSQERLRVLALSKREAEVDDRQAAVDDKRRLMKRAVVKAPIAGTVIYGQHAGRGEEIGVGASVYSGLTLLKIVKRGTMHAELDVAERWLDRVLVGQPVAVRAALRGTIYPGKVLSVSKLATAQGDDPKAPRQFRVVVRLDADEPSLKPNMSCLADIEIARHAKVARVPVDLVRTRSDRTVSVAARRGRVAVDLTASVVDEDRDFVYVTGLSGGEVLIY